MLYRPSSFRKSAIAATTAVALASASALASFPAAAQQVNVVSTSTSDCSSIQDSTKRAVCMVERVEKDTQSLKAQGEASDKRAAEADRRGAVADQRLQFEAALKKCLVQLSEYKKVQPNEFTKLGTITRDNACDKAAKLPRVSASLN
jgi:hypothetical protein